MSKILISDILPCEGADCIKVVLMIIISACVILAWVDSSWIGPTEKKIWHIVNRFILIHSTYSTIPLGYGLLSVSSESQVATSIEDLINCCIYFLSVFSKNGIPIFHLIALWRTKFLVVDENRNIGCRTAGIKAYRISFINPRIIKLLFQLYHTYEYTNLLIPELENWASLTLIRFWWYLSKFHMGHVIWSCLVRIM